MIKSLLFSALLSLAFIGQAQNNTPTDAQGRKHGIWKKYYDNGKLRFQGRFEHGVEVDTFTFYFESGALRAKNVFVKGAPGECMSYQYGEGEVLAAKGKYKDTKKTGEWVFYDANGTLLAKEINLTKLMTQLINMEN